MSKALSTRSCLEPPPASCTLVYDVAFFSVSATLRFADNRVGVEFKSLRFCGREQGNRGRGERWKRELKWTVRWTVGNFTQRLGKDDAVNGVPTVR